MTNQEIANRIEIIKSLSEQYDSDFMLGEISEERYYELNQELIDEIEILEDCAKFNNRKDKFDQMMGNPIKIIEGWFK